MTSLEQNKIDELQGRRKSGCLMSSRFVRLVVCLAFVFVIYELNSCYEPGRVHTTHRRRVSPEASEAGEIKTNHSGQSNGTPLLSAPLVSEHQDSNQWLLFDLSTGSAARQQDPLEDDEPSGELSSEIAASQRLSPFSLALDELSANLTKSFKSIVSPDDNRQQEKSGAHDKQLSSRRPRAGRRRRATRTSNKPILNEFSFPANLVQGMRFVLMCQVLDGEPPIQIKWFKDTQELNSNGNLQLVSATGEPQQQQQQPSAGNKLDDQVELISSDELGSSLLFRKIKQQHGGNYTCSATNRFGSASYSSVMSVKVPPNWRIEPQDRESVLGEQVTIDCQATGNPNPFIRWKFTSVQLQDASQQQQQRSAADSVESNGNHLHANNFKLINSNHQVQTLENGSLAIRQTNKEHDGFYLCEADNGVEPSLVKAIRLTVHLQAHFVDDIQVFLSDGNNHQLARVQPPAPGIGVGQTTNSPSSPPGAIKSVRLPQNTSLVRLVCSPFGDSPLQLDWLKDGHLIYSHSSSSGGLDGKLSSSTEDNQSLPAIEQLDSSSDAPPTTSSASAASISIGRYHVNSRRAGGASTPKHHRPSTGGGLESELILANLVRHDAGVYTCLAKNAYGQAEGKLRLMVQEQPEAPTMIDVAHVSSRSIGLRWLSPFDGNSPIVKYIIEYKRQTLSEQQQQLSSGSKFAPVDSDAALSRSEKLMPALVSGGAPVKEAAATLLSGGARSGLYSNQLLEEQQQLASHAIDSASSQQQTIQHTIHDLEPLTRYSIRIIAVNSLGQSRPSVALSLRTEEEVPSTVPNLVEATVLSSKSIKLRWTISYPLEHELIDGFFVGYRSFDTSALLVAAAEPAAASTTIGGDSSFGGSTQQTPLSTAAQQQQQQQQQQQIASAKQSIERPTFTYKTIRLTNQQPLRTGQDEQQAPGGGPQQQQQQLSNDGLDSSAPLLSPISTITKTIAGAKGPLVANNQPAAQQTVVVVSNFEYIINGLERNTEYTILIQCFNKKGAGPTSDPVVFKTFSIDPPEKLNLIAEENSESSVRVTWHFMNEQPTGGSMVLSHVPAYTRFTATSSSFDPIDGFVLTFAKISSRSKPINRNELANDQQRPDSAARISHPILLPGLSNYHQANNASQLLLANAANLIKQWHAVQLAPQQRTHLLKNLECGSWYAMKILAFNKVGKGEPSDLVTVGTRGKAPVAPDRRSFLSINSTQVRLHLSAWYDGGCEIEKFVVQYRPRNQQQEWILVSNNVLREQNSIIIKNLQPATAYETLVGAQNQVGLTEVKYRFATLDAEGRQVNLGSSSSFLSGSPFIGSDDDEDNIAVDYSDSTASDSMSGDSTRRRIWSSTGMSALNGRWFLVIKQILNSPFTLLLAFCLFVILLILLVINRFNSQGPSGGSTTSTTTLNSSSGSKSNSGVCSGGAGSAESQGGLCTSLAHHHHHLQPSNYHHQQCNADGFDCEPPMSLANDCSTTTPPLTESSPSHVNLPPVDRLVQQQHPTTNNAPHGDYAARLDCYGGGSGYACGGAVMSQPAAPTATTMSFSNGDRYATASNQSSYYSQTNPTGATMDSHYASVHRSATMDAPTSLANAAMGHLDHQDGQQCLMQMLLMAPQQQQQQQLDSMSHQQQSTPYSAAALTTLANRHKSGTLRLPTTSSSHHQQLQTSFPSMTLGRQQIQHYQTFQAPGKL